MNLTLFDSKNTEELIKDGFGKNLDVYAIVNKIAGSAKRAKWGVFEVRKNRDGSVDKIPVTNSGLNLVLECPNSLQTWDKFIEEAMIYNLLDGNAYINGTTAVGMGDAFRQLSVMQSQFIDIIEGDAINPIAGYEYNNGKLIKFSREEVLHIKYPNPVDEGNETLKGLSPLRIAQLAFKTGNNNWEANANILNNRGVAGVLTNESDQPFSGKEKGEIQSHFDSMFTGVKKFAKTMITTAKLKYLQMGMSPTDLKIIENTPMTLRALCNVYGVDSGMFNDPANKTYNNALEAQKTFWENAVIPKLDEFKTGLNGWLVPAWSKKENKNLVIDYNVDHIGALQADKKEQTDRVALLLDKGLVSIETAQEMLGLPITKNNTQTSEE